MIMSNNMYNILFILFLFLIIVLIFTYALYYNNHIFENFDNSRSEINKNIESIYYINLEKREDRKKEFLDNFNPNDESKIIRIRGHYYPENGAVGCLMSHINALNQALNDNINNKNDNILICEDDFVIKDMTYCNKMLELFFDNFENNKWDVIMLGQNTIDSKDTGIETENHEKIIKILNSQTASGYLVKKEYIPRLLKIYENDMNNYIKTGKWGNYYVDQSWKVLQKTDNWYSFYPPVGIQSGSLSDIETGLPKVGLE
jgi:GR25 family glycosyltransferase involved in LPS biosynthesis